MIYMYLYSSIMINIKEHKLCDYQTVLTEFEIETPLITFLSLM